MAKNQKFSESVVADFGKDNKSVAEIQKEQKELTPTKKLDDSQPSEKKVGRPKQYQNKPTVISCKMDQEIYDKLQAIADAKYHGNKSKTIISLVENCFAELNK